MFKFHPLKSCFLKRIRSHCALETENKSEISCLATANPIPEPVWSKEKDAFVLIRKSMGEHGVQKLQLGDAIC